MVGGFGLKVKKGREVISALYCRSPAPQECELRNSELKGKILMMTQQFSFTKFNRLRFDNLRRYLWNVPIMLVVLLGACRAVEYTGDSYIDGIPMQSDGEFILECVDGVIIIETWDQPEVAIRTQRKIFAPKKEQASDFAKSLVIVKQEDSNVHVITIPEGKPDEIKRVEVNYEIHLPHGTRIELRNAGSKIERPSIKGHWVYHSANGRFAVKSE
jgi:hypothetical protein